MNDKYTETIYPDWETDYPRQLCRHLYDKFGMAGGHKMLDVGCGKGTHTKWFREMGVQVLGIDKRVPHTVGFEEVDVDGTKWSDITKYPCYDFVFSKSVVEHIRHQDNFFQQCYKSLKQGGLVIIMTPDWRSQMKHFWDDYTHVHAFTRKSLRDALTINGFTSARCEEFYQLPFLWKRPWLKFIPKLVSLLPDSWKWKDETERNGRDHKLIRFSKEKMLLAWGYKPE